MIVDDLADSLIGRGDLSDIDDKTPPAALNQA